MSKARLVITAVVVEGRSQADVAREYRVSKGWVSKLVARYRVAGDAAFEPRSRRPHSSPNKTPDDIVEMILVIRDRLVADGHDAGADKIGWHLAHDHQITVSRPTVNRTLIRHGRITPEPKKRPRSSYIRFQADLPDGQLNTRPAEDEVKSAATALPVIRESVAAATASQVRWMWHRPH